MSYNFSSDEIFEMAKQMEINGATFYRDAAKKVEGEEKKKFLLHLALMEDAHEKLFAAMQKEITDKEKGPQIFDPAEETILYLRALADSRVFFKKESPKNSILDILTSALEAEKESIIFYVGMKEMVPEKLGKNRIDGIIKEEMSHVRLLSEKLKEYQ